MNKSSETERNQKITLELSPPAEPVEQINDKFKNNESVSEFSSPVESDPKDCDKLENHETGIEFSPPVQNSKDDETEKNESVCSKEDAIEIVKNWYKISFWTYLGKKGRIHLKTCHENIVQQLQEKMQQSMTQSNAEKQVDWASLWKYWEEIRFALESELSFCEKILEEIQKSNEVTIKSFEDGYNKRMIGLLESRITKWDVNSLKNDILKADKDILKEYLNFLDEKCLHELTPQLKKIGKEKILKILSVVNISGDYNELMIKYLHLYMCYSDECFADLQRKMTGKVLEECGSKRGLPDLKSLEKHILHLGNQHFEEINQKARKIETEALLKILEEADEIYMNELMANQVYTSKDIKTFHGYIISYLIQVVNNCFHAKIRGYDTSWLKTKLEERVPLWLKFNDRQTESSLKFLKKSFSEVEQAYTEGMKCDLSKKAFSPVEFEFFEVKRKTEAIEQLMSKLKDHQPNGRLKQIQALETQMKKLTWDFQRENEKNLKSEESLKCPTPILLIEFGINWIRIGYVDGSVKSDDSLKKIRNFVTFTANGDFLVGKSTPEKLYEIYVDQLLLPSKNGTYPKKLYLPTKKIEIPINLYFIASLIFTFIKETVEINGIEFPSVVITIPQWFATKHRLAVKNAGIVAGFKQVFLINDLSAAALTCYQNCIPRTINNPSDANQLINPKVLIISANEEICYAGLFGKEEINGEQVLQMLYNSGNFHLQPSKDIHGLLLMHFAGIHPNISHVMICCGVPELESRYCSIVQSRMPSCTNFMAHENATLVGAAKYSEMLADRISTAQRCIQGKTFYHLRINDQSNSELMKVNTDYGVPVSSNHTVDTTGKIQLRIFETVDEKLKTITLVDNLLYEGRKGDKIRLTCTANREGCFEIHTSKGLLQLKGERLNNISKYSEIIDKHFKKDKKFELMRKSMMEVAGFMLEHIDVVSGIMREQIQEEVQEALQLGILTNAEKELVQEKMMILEKFKKRYYSGFK